MQKENQKFYRTAIFLDSPYKWGPGYSEASREEIESNNNALIEIMKEIGFKKYEPIFERDHGSCPSYYNEENKFEEIYLHPMEISGTMTIETRNRILQILNDKNYSHTKFDRITVGEEEIPYTFEQVLEILNNNVTGEKLEQLFKKTHGYMAMNEDISMFGFNFKEYCFVKMIDRNVEIQKEFARNFIQEKLNRFKNIKGRDCR